MAKSVETLSDKEDYQEKLKQIRIKSRRKTIVIVMGALVVLITGFVLLRGMSQKDDGALQRETAAKAGIMPGMSDAEITDRLNRIVKDSEVNVAMNAQPVLKDGKLNVAIENIPANKFAFRVKVVMDITEKILVETDLIDPDHYLESVKVSEKMEPGAYDATAIFTCYDPETLQKAGMTALKIVVLVSDEKEKP
ncbi:MAG: hypothetical protein RR867_07570 [Ruthenibacterium sp.]